MSEKARLLHHPVFSEFTWTSPGRQDDVSVNSIGAKQRTWYDSAVIPNAAAFKSPSNAIHAVSEAAAEGDVGEPGAGWFPAFNEEYFEWLDILESVKTYAELHSGHRPYVFAELGAGFGRWSAIAVRALRQKSSASFMICAVEADAQHFEWLKQNLHDNGIDPDTQLLVHAPLTGNGRRVSFLAGGYGHQFGQMVVRNRYGFLRRVVERVQSSSKHPGGRVPFLNRFIKPLGDMFIVKLESVTFRDVLGRFPHVIDIADLDLQGVEAEVIDASLPAINDRILRLHIGTHSHEIERRLRNCLKAAGWVLLRDYECNGRRDTPYGQIAFGDGVQSWLARAGNRSLSLGAKHPPL